MGVEQTRRRIVEATAELHEHVGPADTTITAIAERAGVERVTVYRHFPDEGALIDACSSHWRDDHPLPDSAQWSGIGDPGRRLREALLAIYGYFRDGAPMLEQVLRDEDEIPELAATMEPWWGWMTEVAGGLAAGWGVDAARQRRVRAAVGHALRFSTWRSLTDEGLSEEEAAEMMTAWVRHAAGRGEAG